MANPRNRSEGIRMQCATFHRQALSDPLRLAPEALKHAGGCPSCTRFYFDLCRQEAALYQSLGQPVPGALASHQQRLDRVTQASSRTSRLPRALALSLALTAALGVGLMALTRPDPAALSAAAIDHVRAEPQALVGDQRPAPERIADAFDRAGAVLVGAPEVSYAGRCPLPGGGLGEPPGPASTRRQGHPGPHAEPAGLDRCPGREW